MKFIFTQCYQDGYRLLDRDKQSLVKHALDLFQDDPFDPFLNNHLLRKPLGSKRSISVDDDLRIIFQIKGEYREILLLDVGDHDRFCFSDYRIDCCLRHQHGLYRNHLRYPSHHIVPELSKNKRAESSTVLMASTKY